jgi:hypothetical protein
MRRFESWQWIVICLSSVAGLFVAISWLSLLAMPFADWPRSAIRVAQCMVPALFIRFAGGWSPVLVFTFAAVSNAVLYGILSFIILAVQRISN